VPCSCMFAATKFPICWKELRLKYLIHSSHKLTRKLAANAFKCCDPYHINWNFMHSTSFLCNRWVWLNLTPQNNAFFREK
jgi:hypothetical protein